MMRAYIATHTWPRTEMSAQERRMKFIADLRHKDIIAFMRSVVKNYHWLRDSSIIASSWTS